MRNKLILLTVFVLLFGMIFSSCGRGSDASLSMTWDVNNRYSSFTAESEDAYFFYNNTGKEKGVFKSDKNFNKRKFIVSSKAVSFMKVYGDYLIFVENEIDGRKTINKIYTKNDKIVPQEKYKIAKEVAVGYLETGKSKYLAPFDKVFGGDNVKMPLSESVPLGINEVPTPGDFSLTNTSLFFLDSEDATFPVLRLCYSEQGYLVLFEYRRYDLNNAASIAVYDTKSNRMLIQSHPPLFFTPTFADDSKVFITLHPDLREDFGYVLYRGGVAERVSFDKEFISLRTAFRSNIIKTQQNLLTCFFEFNSVDVSDFKISNIKRVSVTSYDFGKHTLSYLYTLHNNFWPLIADDKYIYCIGVYDSKVYAVNASGIPTAITGSLSWSSQDRLIANLVGDSIFIYKHQKDGSIKIIKQVKIPAGK